MPTFWGRPGSRAEQNRGQSRFRGNPQFAKTPQQLSVLLMTCYTDSLHVIHFKSALNSGESQLVGSHAKFGSKSPHSELQPALWLDFVAGDHAGDHVLAKVAVI